MIVLAPCKINIGLRVLDKRNDGFYNLDSYLYPIPLYDIIEISKTDKDELIQTGIISTSKQEDNLVYKAIQIMRKYYSFPFVKIHLHKQIPIEAGLGGGSSDAISTIKIINSYFQLNISQVKMLEMALVLGSDCPFFIKAIPSQIKGKGEIISSLDISLAGKYIMLVKPSFSISTTEAFKEIETNKREGLPNINKVDIENWTAVFTNDFEISLEKKFTEITQIKNKLLEHGAIYASLSGSGSTVFGIFNSVKNIPFNDTYFTWFGSIQ